VHGAGRIAVEVGDLPREDISAAVDVLARGMRDNPLHIAAFGPAPERRVRSLQRMFGTLFRASPTQRPICARRDGEIVGVTGDAPPGACRATPMQRLRFLPVMVAIGPRASARVGRWLKIWGEHDPSEPHSHLGPLAADAHLQGRGIGGQIMAEYCRRLDRSATVGYLETDREENVGFYTRFGFETVGEADVIGVPNWFMRREPGHGAR
jgi:ribosomal protein S18 acetylase RimI-like enzyme